MQTDRTRIETLREYFMLALVLMGLMVLVCAPITMGSESQPEEGGKLILWQKDSPNTFLGYYSLGDYALYPSFLIFDTLFALDPQGDFYPHIANSYEIAEDNVTHTYHLNKEARWHDGKPLTSEDVRFTIEVLAAPGYTGNQSGVVMSIIGAEEYHNGLAEGIKGIDVIDESTISVTLKEIDVSFNELFCTRLFILPQHLLCAEDISTLDKSDFAMSPVGSGPFKFKEYRHGEYFVFERFDDYHLGQPYLDQVIIRIMDPEVAVAAMKAGEVDGGYVAVISDIPPDAVSSFQGDPNFNVEVFDTDLYFDIVVNHTHEFLEDPRFRQALSYAIDSKALIEGAERGFGSPAYSPLQPGSPFDNPDARHYEYNPDKARKLLEEVGWPSDRVLVYGTPNDPRRVTIATMVQQYLQAVGVKTSIESYDFATLMDKANQDSFDIWNLAWSSGGTVHPHYTIFHTLHSSQWPPQWNFGWYQNSEVDSLIEKGSKTVNRDESISIYKRLQEIIAEDVAYIYLYHASSISVMNTRVHNFVDNAHGPYYNAFEWWVDRRE